MQKIKRARSRSKVHVPVRVMIGTGLILAASAAAAFGFASVDPGVFKTKTIVISRSTASPSPDIIVRGSSLVPAGVFSLTGRGDAFTVETVIFSNCVASVDLDGDCADRGETRGDETIVESAIVQFTTVDGAVQTSAATLRGNTLSFTDLDLYVPKDGTTELSLFVNASDYDAVGTESGAQIQFYLNAMSEKFVATGVETDVRVTEASARRNIPGTALTARYTKPTVTLSSSSPSGTVVMPGIAAELLRFNVSADSAGDVELTEGTFGIVTTDESGTSWNTCDAWGSSGASLVDRSTGHSVLLTVFDTRGNPCTPGSVAGYFAYEFPDTGTSSDMGIIPAGSTKTYSLYSDFDLGVGSTDDAIRAAILEVEDALTLDTPHVAFGWNDGSASGTIDGTYVKSLPVYGSMLLFP